MPFSLLLLAAAPTLGLPAAAFGGVYVDPALGREGSAAGNVAARNCSDETLYCLEGDVIDIVLARACAEWKDGQRWTKAGLTTRLFAGPERQGHAGPYRLWFAATEGKWNTAFVLTETNGLVTLVHDPERKHDFWRQLEEGRFAGWLESAAGRAAQQPQIIFQRVSSEALMPCR